MFRSAPPAVGGISLDVLLKTQHDGMALKTLIAELIRSENR